MPDPVVQQVVVDTNDAESAFKRLGETGAEAFSKIIEAASHGNFTGLASLVGGEIGGSFAEAAKSILEFAEAQSRAIEKTEALSEVFGTTLAQTAGLQEAFAAAGIGVNTLDRLMQRMSMNIAQNWSHIQDSIRTSATASEAAMERVEAASLGVTKAQEALAEQGTHAAQTAVGDLNAIEHAQINLLEAQNKLNTPVQRPKTPQHPPHSKKQGELEQPDGQPSSWEQPGSGGDPLAARKQQLAIRDAELALEKANTKAVEDSIQAEIKRKEAEDAVKASITKKAEAEEHASEVAAKSIPNVIQLVNTLKQTGTDASSQIKVADVSVQNLARGIEAATAASGKMPQGFDVLKEIAELFKSTDESVLGFQQRLEILQKVGGVSLRAMGGDAAKLVHLLSSEGVEGVKQFEEATKKLGLTLSGDDTKAATDLEAAFGKLGSRWDEIKAKMAVALAPGLVEFIDTFRTGLEKAFPVMEAFAKILGDILKDLAEHPVIAGALGGAVAGGAAGGLPGAAIGAGLGAGAVIATPWLAQQNKPPEEASTAASEKTTQQESINADKTAQNNDKFSQMIDRFNQAVGQNGSNPSNLKFASGGIVRGPSGIDTVPAWLTSGEYVMNNKAVARYGKNAMDAINNGVAKFAAGGWVDSGFHQGSAGPGFGRSYVGTATIQGQHPFNTEFILDTGNAGPILIHGETAKGAGLKPTGKAQIFGVGGLTDVQTATAPLSVGGLTKNTEMYIYPDNSIPQLIGLPFLNMFTDFAIGKTAVLLEAATGGFIRGPGTATSDSILARLSNGEFVQQAKAVSHYGVDFMNAINDLKVPKNMFANGGFVGPMPRFAGGGIAEAKGGSTVNLTIGTETFKGLTAPPNVAAKLKTYAISQQVTRTGNMPSWVK